MDTMTEPPASRFVRVARIGDVGRARIIAARLRSEGIEVRIHSEALGPYPVTVGHLATAELWIPSDRVDEAALILLDADVSEILGGVDTDRVDDGLPVEYRIVALILVVVFVGAVVARLMRVF